MSETETKRLTFDVGVNFYDLLEKEANAASVTKAEIIRRAVATYAYLRLDADDNGKVTIVSADGSSRHLILFSPVAFSPLTGLYSQAAVKPSGTIEREPKLPDRS